MWEARGGTSGEKARSAGITRCAKAARHSSRPEGARGDEAPPPPPPPCAACCFALGACPLPAEVRHIGATGTLTTFSAMPSSAPDAG